ncbi:hypothetical protein NKG94_13055 [Micromonospora sp. M12]
MRPTARASRRTLLRAAAAGATALAAGCSGGTRSVQVAVVWSTSELDRFRQVVAGYPAPVQVVSAGNDIDAFLRARHLAGTSPDVAILPRPAWSPSTPSGWLSPLRPSAEYAVPGGLGELLMPEGRRYGVWVKAAHKSLVWHLPSMLPERPADWDELVGQTQRLGALARRTGGPARWPSVPRTAGCSPTGSRTSWPTWHRTATTPSPAGTPTGRASRCATPWIVSPGSGASTAPSSAAAVAPPHPVRGVGDPGGVRPAGGDARRADFTADVVGTFRRGREAPVTFRFPGSQPGGGPLIVGGDAAVAFADARAGRAGRVAHQGRLVPALATRRRLPRPTPTS